MALCLVVFGLGDAVERGLAGHVGLDAALTYAVSAEPAANASPDHSGLHVDERSGDDDRGGPVVGHGCHGCAALPGRMAPVVAAPAVLGSSLAWASVPSAAGRAPLIDLPPPRA
ncbi:hypothetical protein ACFQ4O_02405 [Methylopila musalis]|uniref:DUF2946 domain-containing protein n=1 Tax=Methylopila musalis TaxID=1134781 RepID=A0ABW3Z3S0_9HYPH